MRDGKVKEGSRLGRGELSLGIVFVPWGGVEREWVVSRAGK